MLLSPATGAVAFLIRWRHSGYTKEKRFPPQCFCPWELHRLQGFSMIDLREKMKEADRLLNYLELITWLGCAFWLMGLLCVTFGVINGNQEDLRAGGLICFLQFTVGNLTFSIVDKKLTAVQKEIQAELDRREKWNP